jgi:hypothetical protein
MALPSYVVWFRGFPACPCLAAWLPVFERELIRRGVIRESIDIAQLIGGASASGGTHASGGAFDIWQHDPKTMWVARQMGADATWNRVTGSFATNRHTHGVLTGCPHNGPARYQIDEVRAGGDGLVGSTPDPGPRPLSGRTWREGIAWARQQEDIMATTKELAELLDRKLQPIKDALVRARERDFAQNEKINKALAGLDELSEKVSDDATRKQVGAVRQLVLELTKPEETP